MTDTPRNGRGQLILSDTPGPCTGAPCKPAEACAQDTTLFRLDTQDPAPAPGARGRRTLTRRIRAGWTDLLVMAAGTVAVLTFAGGCALALWYLWTIVNP